MLAVLEAERIESLWQKSIENNDQNMRSSQVLNQKKILLVVLTSPKK